MLNWVEHEKKFLTSEQGRLANSDDYPAWSTFAVHMKKYLPLNVIREHNHSPF